MANSDIFAIPIGKKVLIYAPLQGVSALINRPAYFEWSEYLRNDRTACPETAKVLFSSIFESVPAIPSVRSGPLTNPLFLGILPTRACNMGCRYCDFLESSRLVMPVEIARDAIESYLDLLGQNGLRTGEIHFFGGEPFEVPELVQFSVEFARIKAKERKISLRFEAVTNGFYSNTIAEWASQNIDTIVLSFDGFAGCQDHHRPSKEGTLSFETVSSNARLFSESDCELIIRSCISDENVRDLREWAGWIGENLLPSVVCLEPMIETGIAKANRIKPADPALFVRNFCEAAGVLANYGIPTVFSTADLTACRNSVCPL
jgi:sulfatase maturation enzyme AslB (radical SAM superfamily)